MITIQQHIDQQHGGNVSAFARSVNASRPTVYSWLQRGSMWHAGRVWDPVTPDTGEQAADVFAGCYFGESIHTTPQVKEILEKLVRMTGLIKEQPNNAS